MTTNIPFWKMHGAANDFILVDDRTLAFPERDSEWIAEVTSRRTGVGSDGLILIQPSQEADFRMRFFNPDGGEVEMCGNGARCIARLAAEIGAATSNMEFDTVAGKIKAEVSGNQVRLHMTDPFDLALNQSFELNRQPHAYHFANTGVPHVVMEVPDIETLDILTLGVAIRYHDRFAPAGTNANFISVTGPDSLRVRTYERGVEAETLACGTGVTACGIIAGLLQKVQAPVRITVASGDEILIDYEATDEKVTNVFMTGPAEHVFQGTLTYASR